MLQGLGVLPNHPALVPERPERARNVPQNRQRLTVFCHTILPTGRRDRALRVFYIRFMDDVLLLAPTRWKLRHATQVVNRVLSGLRLAKHPAKTFIGRISKGFDFLGYHFNHVGLTVAAPTVARFVARAHRLDEQEQREPCGPQLWLR